MSCNICGSDKWHEICRPIGTKLGATVVMCDDCGLVYSIYKKDAVEHEQRITGDATFGNIRYGKGFDVPEAMDMLEASGIAPDSVIDIGCGRGEFARALLNKYSHISMILIEPDEEIHPDLPRGDNIRLVGKRLEEIRNLLPADLIIMNHTLEHLNDPKSQLFKMRKWINGDGRLLVVVPDTERQINRRDVVEEVFIDKHRYHFTAATLKRLLTLCGFIPSIMTHGESIYALCQKDDRYLMGAMSYAKNIQKNRTKVQSVVDKIMNMAEDHNVVVWGAGRIFHLLLDHGLDKMKMYDIVDKYMPAEIRRELMVSTPEMNVNVDMVVVASREYASDIRTEAKKFYWQADVILWSDLL